MRRQTVEFVALTTRTMLCDNVEAFQFRKDRPAQWLQKACFFVLRKLKAFHIRDTVMIERHILDPQSFMGRLFEQQASIRQFFGMQPTELLIGAEDYANLMREEATSHMFSFRSEYVRNDRICGMTVRVIPWMRGVLVMPPNT